MATRKPDKRTRKRQPFEGFSLEVLQSDQQTISTMWTAILEEINSLAEYKIAHYVYHHTIQDFKTPVRITIDDFMHGPLDEEGVHMDSGTGLSNKAVISGVNQALEHGYIICLIDDEDKSNVKKYYLLNLIGYDVEFFHSGEKRGVYFLHSDEEECKNFIAEPPITEPAISYVETSQPSKDSKEIHTDNNLIEDTRIRRGEVSTQQIRYPDFIKIFMESFSSDLGDKEHVAPNIGQCTQIYRLSGKTEDEFVELLYQAKEIARAATNIKKRNSQGEFNRMPYFFRVLRGLVKQEVHA